MSVKIYISSHKDFQWCPTNKEYTLICGEKELKDKYPIDVIEEHPTVLYKNLHDSYAELTRLRYIQMNIKPDADYIGFCQYKRYFTNIDDVEEVMKRKDFYKYCYFLFNIFDTLNRENGWKTMDDIKRDKRQLKTHGFLAERISNVFFAHYFKSPLHRSIIVKR